MLKHPMMTGELFNTIAWQLKGRELIPDILEYALADTLHEEPIRTSEFNIKNNLDFGGSEGIYLSIAIEYYDEGKWHTVHIGTFKTLDCDCDRDAMYAMGKLLADFICETDEYVNAHLDDFEWTGYTVRADGKQYGYTCCTMESALRRKDEFFSRGAHRVVIRDNAVRTEKEYINREAV